MKSFLLALGAVVVLTAACDDGPKQGYIDNTWHEPSQPYTAFSCMRYDRYGQCVLSMPYTAYTDESWHIYLVEKGIKPGWREVAYSTYVRCRLGSHYPDCKKGPVQIGGDE